MPRFSLGDVRGLPDPLQTYQFSLLIHTIPGGAGTATRDLALRCQTCNIPGNQAESVEVNLHGVTTKYAGRPRFTQQVTATFIETRDMKVRDTLRNWIEFSRNARTNSGNYKSSYATSAELQLLDDTNTVVRTIRMHGFWPETMDDPGLDGGASGTVSYSITFSLDFHEDV